MNDLSIIESIINENNIVILSWSSGINYCYLNNNEIVVNKFNSKVINNLEKKYIIYIGDTDITDELNKPIYKYENNITYLFEKVNS